MAYADFLTQTCDILLQRSDQDALGGTVRDAYTVAESHVPTLYRNLGNAIDAENHRRGSTGTGRFYFLTDYGLTTRHQIKLGDRIFNVVGTNDANSLGRVVAVDVEETVE